MFTNALWQPCTILLLMGGLSSVQATVRYMELGTYGLNTVSDVTRFLTGNAALWRDPGVQVYNPTTGQAYDKSEDQMRHLPVKIGPHKLAPVIKIDDSLINIQTLSLRKPKTDSEVCAIARVWMCRERLAYFNADADLLASWTVPQFFSVAAAQTISSAPTVPVRLVVKPVSMTSVNVFWDPSDGDLGVVGYKIYRNGKILAITHQLSYTDTGLQPNTAYAYEVSAFDPYDNDSKPTEPVSVKTFSAASQIAYSKFNNALLWRILSLLLFLLLLWIFIFRPTRQTETILPTSDSYDPDKPPSYPASGLWIRISRILRKPSTKEASANPATAPSPEEKQQSTPPPPKAPKSATKSTP